MTKYVPLLIALFVGIALWQVGGGDVPTAAGPKVSSPLLDLVGAELLDASTNDTNGSGKVGAVQEIDLDCADAPEAAIVDLPEKIRAITRVACSIYGHVLAAPGGGTVWSANLIPVANSENVPGPALLPAYIPTEADRAELGEGKLKIVNHDAFFTSISMRSLTGAEKRERAEALIKGYAEYADADLPDVTEISATNNIGVEQKIYVTKTRRGETVGYFCRPDCITDSWFTVMRWETASDIYILDENGRAVKDSDGNIMKVDGSVEVID